MRKNRIYFWGILFLMVFLMISVTGCSWLDKAAAFFKPPGDDEIVTTEATHGVYYMNKDEIRLLKVACDIDTSSVEALIMSCIEGLKKEPDDENYKSVMMEGVTINNYSYDSTNKQAVLYFDESYKNLNPSKEVLIRAAIVKTLTQFSDEIQYVSFVIGNVQMTASDGSLLMMRGRDFVNNISGNMEYVREDYVTLYFASEDGTKLQSEDVVVKYLSKINLETAVVNSLISGPISKGLKPVLSSDIVVNKVSVKEGVCYVDLDSAFFERIDGQSFQLNIYSIVNSLTQLAGITRVQFLIDGVIFTGAVDGMRIDTLFEKNMSYVYRPKKEDSREETAATERESSLNKDIERQLLENQSAQETETAGTDPESSAGSQSEPTEMNE